MNTKANAGQEAAREALTDICHMAVSIRRLCVLAIEAGGESDEAADLSAAARDLAAQLGWKADMALRALGDHGVVGGAEAWMMPGWPEPAATRDGGAPTRATAGR